MDWNKEQYEEASASMKRRGLEFDKSRMIDKMDRFYQEVACS